MATRSIFAKVVSKESWVRFVDEFFDGDYRISDYDEDALRNMSRTSATDFAIAMARARGYENPEYEIRMLRDLKRRFVARFGTDAVRTR